MQKMESNVAEHCAIKYIYLLYFLGFRKMCFTLKATKKIIKLAHLQHRHIRQTGL